MTIQTRTRWHGKGSRLHVTPHKTVVFRWNVCNWPTYYSSQIFYQSHQFVITESINNKIMSKSSESDIYGQCLLPGLKGKGPNKKYLSRSTTTYTNMIINKAHRSPFSHFHVISFCVRFFCFFSTRFVSLLLLLLFWFCSMRHLFLSFHSLDTFGDTLLIRPLYFRVNNKLLFVTHLFVTSERHTT